MKMDLQSLAPLLLCSLIWLGAATGASAHADTGRDAADSTPGERVFNEHCGGCHSGFLGSRAPSRQVLAKFPPRTIVQALTTGLMRVQGYSLSGEQRREVATYLTGAPYPVGELTESRGRCTKNPPLADPRSGARWNGWGNGVKNASYQSSDAAELTPEYVKQLKLKWAFGFPDSFSAWSHPVVVSGRLFVGSQAGMFYSLSAGTGCTYWQFKADAGIRGAASVVEFGPEARKIHGTRYGVLFGDATGNAYALNASTGKMLWKAQVDSHPKARITGSPLEFEGRYFVPMSSWETVAIPEGSCCTFRGSLSALDVGTGRLLWKTYTIPSEAQLTGSKDQRGNPVWGPSGSAIWAPPAIDAKRRLVYVGTGDSYTAPAINSDSVIALDIENGQMRWAKQLTPEDVWIAGCVPGDAGPCKFEQGPDFDIGSPPMVVSVDDRDGSRDLIVVGQKSGMAYALDPDREGSVVWRYRAGRGGRGGGIVWGSAALGSTVYFPVSDMTEQDPGGLHAVNAATGERRWVSRSRPLLCGSARYGCNAAQPVGISVIPGILFAGAVDGGFRAYSSEDGELLWEYDTNRDFTTTNAVAANGGSLIGSGPTIAGGMVFVNSGYGTNGGRAGNVLLAFSAH